MMRREFIRGRHTGLRSDIVEDICDYSTDENDAVDGQPLSCDRCCYKTQKKWLMDRHSANHAKDKPYRCTSCGYTNRDASVFVEHLGKHLPKTKIIKCCFCSFKAMPSTMKSHVLQHAPTERLDCSECEYWTNSIRSMRDHIGAYHTKKHCCTMCPKVLTRYALDRHMKKAHRTQKLMPTLSENVNLRNRLRKAVASRPGLMIIPVTKRSKINQIGKKPVKKGATAIKLPVVQLERCRVPPECWKSLEASMKPVGTRSGRRKSLEQLSEDREPMEPGSDYENTPVTSDVQTPIEIPKSHQIRKPIYFPSLVAEFGDTLQTCSICDYQTRKEHLLRRHMTKHDGDLPFVCRKCEYQSISVYEFANHMVITHGSVKDSLYSCTFCDFWTHKKHNIPIHLDRHRGAPRVFDCPECEEVLTSKTGLQSHFEKIHCEALDCQFCGKNMTKFELDIHLKEHAAEVLGSNDQAVESSKDRADLSDLEPEKSIEISVRPSNPLRNPKYKPKPLSRKKLDLKSNDGLDSIKAKKVETETSKPASGTSKYKTKPLSKKKLETELETLPSMKLSESPVSDEARTSKSVVNSKYKPKPLCKKILETESDRTSSGTLPESSLNGPSTLGISSTSKYQPRPLSERTLVKSADDSRPTDGPDDARKRKRSPSPTRAKLELSKEEVGKDLVCRYCDYKTEISSLMDRHKEKHKADTPFKCTKCKYETLSSAKISWHYLFHFPSKKLFPCPYCPYDCKTRQSLPSHIERHRPVKFFDCSKCQFSSNHSGGVKKHFERMHVDKYGCAICNKVMTKHAMMKHLKKRHPSVYDKPSSSTLAAKHFSKFMRPINVTSDVPKGKRPKPTASGKYSEDSDSVIKLRSSEEDSGIKAAQAALAREIFGELSDCEDSAKPTSSVKSSITASSKPSSKAIIKSEDSDDSDSDTETVVPKLSCPKCDFTTSQITEVKSHYRDMHEIEYSCQLCHPNVTSTQYELFLHFNRIHPSITPECYDNNMICCAQEKQPESRAPAKIDSEDSDDSDDDAAATTKVLSPTSSDNRCKPPPVHYATEKFVQSSAVSPPEKVEVDSKVSNQLQSPVLIEEPAVLEMQGSVSAVSPISADVTKAPETAELALFQKSYKSCEVPASAVRHDLEIDVGDSEETKAAPNVSSAAEQSTAPLTEKILESSSSATVKTRDLEVDVDDSEESKAAPNVSPPAKQLTAPPYTARILESSTSSTVKTQDLKIDVDESEESKAAPNVSPPAEQSTTPLTEKIVESSTSATAKTHDLETEVSEESQNSEAIIATPNVLSPAEQSITPLTEKTLQSSTSVTVPGTVEIETAIDDETPEIPKMPHQCKECDFHTSRLAVLQRHNVKHKFGAPLICPQCHFQSTSPYKFLIHWIKHSPNRKVVKCCFCAFATVSKMDLALHLCVHNNTRVFDCTECDYSTSTKAFYEGHIWSIHKQVTCQKCQASMDKLELPSHRCNTSKDDDVLRPSHHVHGVAGVSGMQQSVSADKPPTEKIPEVPAGKSGESNERVMPPKTKDSVMPSDSGSAGNHSNARASFKTNDLSKFSFLRKRDDFPSSDVVSSARSPSTIGHDDDSAEVASPTFESLSADNSSSDEESGHVEEPAAKDPSKTEEPVEARAAQGAVDNKTPTLVRKAEVDSEELCSSKVPVDTGDSCSVESPASTEVTLCPAGSMKAEGTGSNEESSNAGAVMNYKHPSSAGEVHSEEQAFATDESMSYKETSIARASNINNEPTVTEEIEEIRCQALFSDERDAESVAAVDSNSDFGGQSQTEEEPTSGKPLLGGRASPNDEESASAGHPDTAVEDARLHPVLSQEDSFTAAHSCLLVPVIDISGKTESPVKAPKPSTSERPSSSWTEPIDSDDEDGEDDDHNYFISPKRANSPAADFSSQADQQRPSPIKSDDFPGDYVTEVVFDNGVTALVLEVSDSSDEEL